jgi:predicted restriction endonuclease
MGTRVYEHAACSQTELIAARAQMLAETEQQFVLVRPDVRRVTTTREAIARDTAFRSTLLAEYQRSCAISGVALTTGSIHEVEAAHIVRLDLGRRR